MTEHNDVYIPITCGQHSQYELAIMHRVMLLLTWRTESGQTHIGKLMPLDLKTQAQQEFLIARGNDGHIHQIRLDRIIHSDVNEAIKA
jgi:transcriptional antiterminator Rof (Rho-off)